MSAALVNRSLTTIRTELEFLKDSDVITEGLYEKLLQLLPTKYQKILHHGMSIESLEALQVQEKYKTSQLPMY